MLDESPMRKGDAVSSDQGSPESNASIPIHQQNQTMTVCPSAIGIKRDIVVVRLRPGESCPDYRFFCLVLETLEKWQLRVGMFSTSPGRITLALGAAALRAVLGDPRSVRNDTMSQDLVRGMRKLLPGDHMELFPHMAIVSVVGHPSRRMAGHIFATMDANDIPTVMISHDAAKLGMIACAISEQYTAKALCVFEQCLFRYSLTH
uniref:LolA n=1 Tax=Epichloe glyceriae TaxID=79591 RepID=G8EB15_9HYPO|nr:LolA [Epichloe glyceriae]